MDIKELQYYWDEMLIGFYGTYAKASWMPIKLIKHFRPDLTNGSRVTKEGFAWFDTLELRRCRDITVGNDLKFCMFSSRVDDFIGAHSMPLLLALIDRKTDNADILKNIRFFKWTRKNHSKSQRAGRKRRTVGRQENAAIHGSGIRFQLRVRENDKRTDWNTVK